MAGRIRSRVFMLLVLLCLVPILYTAPLFPRLYSLLRLPFVWRASSRGEVISQQHDGFDLTFAAFGANYSTSQAGLTPLIPAKLHHIHLGSNPPPAEWIAARGECLKHHNGWQSFLWDDHNAADFVKQNFPHLYDMWKSYPFRVQRVDALRYMVLERHGGVILDFDLACKRSLEPLRRFNFVAPAAHPTGFSVGMLLASPNNTFVKSLVDNLPRFNHRWLLFPYITVMFSTGCHYASTIYTLQQNRTGLRILSGSPDNPRMHMLNGFVDTPLFRHLGSSSWHSTDARLISLFKNIDQRLLFGILVALSVSSVSLMACIFMVRHRSAARLDVEYSRPQFPKDYSKHI